MRIAIALVLALYAGWCSKDETPVGIKTTSLPDTVVLAPGEAVVIPHEGMSLTFRRITADSRCPLGVQCVWAGDAAAWLTVRDQNTTARECTLHTTLDPKFVAVNTLGIRLKRVTPYPVDPEQIDSLAYRVTLELTAKGDDPR